MSKEQPDKTVFRDFITATSAVLTHPDTPPAFYKALSEAIEDAGNKLEAYNEDADDHARRVLSRIFGLPEEEKSKPAAPAPANRFDVSSKFNELAERLAVNLGDDELLNDLIRLAFAIAEEPDNLNRESLALTVANQAFTRTCEFSRRLDGILRDAQPA